MTDAAHAIEAVASTIEKALDRWITYQETRRAWDLGIVFQNSVIALLIVSLAFGVYIKAGESLHPLLAVRLVWIALSTPLMLAAAFQIFAAWRQLRGNCVGEFVYGMGQDELKQWIRSRWLLIAILLAANGLINYFLRAA